MTNCQKILFFFFSFVISFPVLSLAQKDTNSVQVTITIINHKNEPISYASFALVNRLDSSMIIRKVAGKDGKAIFDLLNGSQYSVSITAVNYLPVEKGITVTPGQSSFIFETEPMGKTLDAAVITSQKPLMKQEDDKLIVDPENLVATSTSGFEVLEKTPGLFVDQDGNIYISSMTPAMVQINGRDMKMSAADVATMLKSLPPNSISRIEILRTPSAKYDASGSGGIVNVVLKKGVRIGMTGSVHAGLQQGTYGTQFGGFNLSNNDGKKSSSLNINYSNRNNYEKLHTHRYLSPDSLLSDAAFTRYPADVYFIGYSYNFSAGKKWDLDLSTSTSFNDFKNNTENTSAISQISTGQKQESVNLVRNDGHSLNFRSAVAGTLKIDSLGSEWVNDIFFNITSNKTEQEYSTHISNPFMQIRGGDGKGDNNRHHLNLQSDLKLKLKHRLTFETGARASILTYRSETEYFRENGSSREKDAARTNTFHYNENINSLYIQGAKTLGKNFVLKTGLRMENTNMKGQQIIPDDTSFTIHRTDLFPYLYISKKLMKVAGYELRAYLVYRRTINRPVYEQLNPFPRYINQFLSEAGNPALRPQFNQNYEANISVDERPILAVGINDTRDIFTNVVYQSDTNQLFTRRTYDNLGTNREWYVRGLGAIPPGGRYFFVLGAQYNHNFYQGLYENKPLAFKKGTWTFFTYQTFKIDKRSTITLNGFMRLKGQQQFYELGSFGALNGSVNRRFLKDKLVMTVSVNDMFATNRNEFTINQGSVNAYGIRQGDTRRFGINFRYNFGIRKKEESNNMFNTEPPVVN